MATMWSRNQQIDPANLYPSLAALVEAYDLEGGETVYACHKVQGPNGIEFKNVRPQFLTEADIRDIDRAC
ncbi:hypothetical protein [Aeromonas hydrophila]|uniref:hypothetical protein n=1 Tax=Aeromonas hydrophila TaxID=644 RepID=UPI002B45B929|nr:hypothetical protein [Aeromonas hydrophila]